MSDKPTNESLPTDADVQRQPLREELRRENQLVRSTGAISKPVMAVAFGLVFLQGIYVYELERSKTVNWERIEGNWKQFQGQIQEKWGELKGDELDRINGHRDQLLGKIQEKYGIAKEEAERQITEFERSCSC